MSEVLGQLSCAAEYALTWLSPVSHREEEELWCPVTPIMSHSISSSKSLDWDHLENYSRSSRGSIWVAFLLREGKTLLGATMHPIQQCLRRRPLCLFINPCLVSCAGPYWLLPASPVCGICAPPAQTQCLLISHLVTHGTLSLLCSQARQGLHDTPTPVVITASSRKCEKGVKRRIR